MAVLLAWDVSIPGVQIVRVDGAKRCEQKKKTVRGWGRGESERKPAVLFLERKARSGIPERT